MLDVDPDARVACEVAANMGVVFVLGEITCKGYVEIAPLVRDVICRVGYDRPELGFDGHTCGVVTSIKPQSPNIAQGVDRGKWRDKYDRLGAGDQGIVVGFACNETFSYMPLVTQLANEISCALANVRHFDRVHGKWFPHLRPDGKTQVTLRYENGFPIEVSKVVIAAQHDPDIDEELFGDQMFSFVVEPVLARYNLLCKQTTINGTGAFVIGGPVSDTGFTGRKIIVDSYGPVCTHGGGAFSGKDPTKVDRSGAYMARHVAKCLVAAQLCEEAEVRVAYCIGNPNPLSIQVLTGSNGVREYVPDLTKLVEQTFDFRPAAIIERLGLVERNGWKYQHTATGGHFGRKEFPWEDITEL
jgi:S-adenosylmethionine synthetase